MQRSQEPPVFLPRDPWLQQRLGFIRALACAAPGVQLPALDGLILLPALPGSPKTQQLTPNNCLRGAGDSPVGTGENHSHCYSRNPSFLICICCISPPQGEQGCHRPEGTGWNCSGISSARRVSGTGNPMALPEPETLPPTFYSIPPFPPLLPSPYKDSVALSGAAVSARPPLGFRRNTINNSENLKNSHKGEGPGWCPSPRPLGRNCPVPTGAEVAQEAQ